MGDGGKLALVAWCVALAAAAASAEPRAPAAPRHAWARGARTLDQPKHFVGPHVCRSRNSTHCCPGWTSRPNSMLCIVPVCRDECGNSACVAPNMCRCPDGIEAPACGTPQAPYPYPARNPDGCRRICMNGGTCTNGTCACAPGWSGEYCTEPICRSPCLAGGRCVAPDRCACFHGLSGTHCEIDRRTGPCYTETRGALCSGALEGVVCTRQLCCATVGRAWGHPCQRCGDLDCPAGHLRNLHTRACQDIDECAAIPGLCDGGKCINSVGSFSCECSAGFARDLVTNNCQDVDECRQTDICPNGRCVNTEGDYYCLCNPHFIPSPDKKFCIDGRVSECYTYVGETGECSDRLPLPLSNRDCCCGHNMGRAWGPLCSPCPPRPSEEWSHLCGGGAGGAGVGGGGAGVPPGWRRNASEEAPLSVAKIDECTLRSGICELGNCIDKDVGYECECWEGAEATSQDGNPTCIDIDECALGFCAGGTCVNRPGGFECRCPAGFDPVDGGRRCSDKNECEATNGGMCTNGVCTNMDGGFECACNPGYEPSESGRACRDVDECAANPRVCRRGRCRNLPGGYRCLCDLGYEHSAARGHCVDIDECAAGNVCQGGRCINNEGSYTCICEAGYRAGGGGGACADVDECAEVGMCLNGRCTNTPGSFKCDCLPGFVLDSHGRRCLDTVEDMCYESYSEGSCSGPGARPVTRSQCCCAATKGVQLGWGVSCASCPSPGSAEYAALCRSGAGRDNAGTDINECTTTPGICPHGACHNTEPGFRCICDPGFHADENGICRDIDDCHMHESLCSGGQCKNTLGSYECVCPAGTRLDAAAQRCADVDECAGERGDIPPLTGPTGQDDDVNPCENGRCTNTHGGYECECEPGFVLDASGTRCIDNRRGSCWRRIVDGQCEGGGRGGLLRQECCCGRGLAWGAPCEPCLPHHCPCPPGHAQLDGVTCRDIDECELEPGLCVGGKCVNTDGSYHCECAPPLTLDDSSHRCVDVRVEVCYTSRGPGGCAAPAPAPASRAVCCCSALGRAWGAACQPCPRPGTEAHRDLCISEFEGSPTIYERPDLGYNRSDIWSQHGIGDDGGELYDHSGSGGPGGSGRGPGPGVWGGGVTPGQLDVNECAAFPGLCGHGRCRNLPGSFTCDCFPGYEKDSNNHTCVDVDECSIVDNPCGAGTCRNTPGGFTCECRDGHRANPNTQLCEDIDECAEKSNVCRGGVCRNTAGSYSCECPAGTELAADGLACRDVDECSLTSGICSNGACENLMGSYQCVCDNGYAQSRVKSHCEDIDECAEDAALCEHECLNTPGSFHCKCRDGWHLRADGRTCRDVNECLTPRVCGGGDCHNLPGSYRCHCGPGLRPGPTHLPPTCKDVDECSEIDDLCGAGTCRNTIGSFVCQCPDGYSVRPDASPACVDDDECELGTCRCHDQATCTNTEGSFECTCNAGWRGDGFECSDVDECHVNNGGCHPRAACSNTPGSFACLCHTGYRGDGYQCVDIDECANDPTLCENGHCSNTPGGYECLCDVGFTQSPDSMACLDLDECSTFDNVCVFGRCENTYGMFKCICDKGYQPDSTVDDLMPGFNCTDIDECLSPQSCQYGRCVNTPGSYLCHCPPNYDLVSDGSACFDSRVSRCYARVSGVPGVPGLRAGDERCLQRDQLSGSASMAACCCSVGVAWGDYCDLCPEPGSEEYRQLCPGGPGYQPVLEPPSYVVTLADIDECLSHPSLCAHGSCTNTFGSYVCTCGAGWRLAGDGLSCVDVDECADKDVCGPGVCRNLPGSYVCLCPEGYVPMPSQKECVDVRQRQCYMEWDEETEQCSNAVGVPQTKYLCCCSVGRAWGAPCAPCPARGSAPHVALCGEKPGEYINPVTNQTNPIDECDLMPQLCKPGACHDTSTGFHCACDHGYAHDNTSHQCRDVDECLQSPCRGLAHCVNIPGGYECRCPAGYTHGGSPDDCEDEDECARPRACHGGRCTNTQGSYRCECGAGYMLRDGACVDVDECSRPRSLCHNGTCHNTPGGYRCLCQDGYRPLSDTECVDINECREGDMVCRNGRCRNTPGSFQCSCTEGFVLSEDGRHCRDVDECHELDNPCGELGDPVCTNTNGGYECACAAGWRAAAGGRGCEDRDECRESRRACDLGLCHNLPGGYRCECPEGWRFDEVTSVCVDERRELCYERHEDGRCHLARPLHLSKPECCCSEGAAWGRYCERCPPQDSFEFLQICPGGMGRPNFTQDLNECVVRPNLCAGGSCVNTDGSYRCACPPGKVLSPDGSRCVDADECSLEPALCGNGTCLNTDPGFRCHCHAGYEPGPDQRCVDIDECAEGLSGCAFRCHNTLGAFKCTCPLGYTLAADGVHCRDLDECADNPCPYSCENTLGSYICTCPEGFRRTSAPQDAPGACEDVDECAEAERGGGGGGGGAERGGGGAAALCGPGRCVNTPGGYSCRCPPGHETDEKGTSCVDRRTGQCFRTVSNGRCEDEPWPSSLASTPSPTAVTKAQCCCSLGMAWGEECELCPPPGSAARRDLCDSLRAIDATGVGADLTVALGDVDECAAIPTLCLPGRCVNTIGSFRCSCGAGYVSSKGSCSDVDECSLRPSPCDQLCTNTEGSYLCRCNAGYELDEDGAKCVDVDECARGTHTCQQGCANTRGSYECSCDDGYEQRGDACIDLNECQLDPDICPAGGRCVNLAGSYRCVCGRGLRLSADGDRCLDVDECVAGRCSAPCRNLRGSHHCLCPPGTTRSGKTCLPVDVCATSPCGAAPCFPLAGTFRCGCPSGYLWQPQHQACLQMSGGCATSNCLWGCDSGGGGAACGCPAGYRLVAAGHCLAHADFGDAPVYPLGDQYATADKDILSTEGCFSCKVNGRHRRAPDEGIIYANGTTLLRRKKRRRVRRSALQPDVELIVVKKTPDATWGRQPLLRFLPTEGNGRAHYRIAYGDDDKDFVLNKKDGIWTLRLRKHVKAKATFERQIEIEARFVPRPDVTLQRRRRHLDDNAPPPLRLYVTVHVEPKKTI